VAHPREKDQTDLELALLAAVGHNAETIRILGAMGGRLDMTVANILLLSLPELSDTDVELWHGDQTAWLIRPPGGTLRAEPGDTISLIPLGGEARGITSQDLEYSLENGSLQRGPAKGVSNVVSGPNPQIELSAGALLVVLTPERS
jgi:thiamine pyrophosphokinase